MDIATAKSLGLKRQRPKRVGRGPGSGSGKTSGRGHRGQQSRSGYSRRLWFEGGQMPLYRRLPRRGFNNKNFATRYTIVNVQDLEVFDASAEVDLDKILEIGVTSLETKLLKVLGKGEITKPLTVMAHKFSESAKQKIEAAGGKAIVIEGPVSGKVGSEKSGSGKGAADTAESAD